MCLPKSVANPHATTAAGACIGGHDNAAYHVDVGDSVSNHDESTNWNGNTNTTAGGFRHGGGCEFAFYLRRSQQVYVSLTLMFLLGNWLAVMLAVVLAVVLALAVA